MSVPHFEIPDDNTHNYAIWDYDPMNFQIWLDPLRDFFNQLEETNDHTEITDYRKLFEDDVQQYIHHLLKMAPFSRSQVSLYNIICRAVCTTKDLNRLLDTSKWGDGQLPESFVALMTDAIRLGIPIIEADTAMKAYGNLIIALAESFLGNDRRRISTIMDAENIYNLFSVVAAPFVSKNHLEPWKKRQDT